MLPQCAESNILLLSWLITVDVGWYVIVEYPLATVAFWGHHVPLILTVDNTFKYMENNTGYIKIPKPFIIKFETC